MSFLPHPVTLKPILFLNQKGDEIMADAGWQICFDPHRNFMSCVDKDRNSILFYDGHAITETLYIHGDLEHAGMVLAQLMALAAGLEVVWFDYDARDRKGLYIYRLGTRAEVRERYGIPEAILELRKRSAA